MGHQCTKCGKIYPDAAEELLNGCECGTRFFYYIRQEKLDELNRLKDAEIQETIEHLEKSDKEQIERDIREITGLDEEPEKPVVLDLESVKVLKPGKFEIDIINLFSKKRPLIYKLEEGKYIIDLAASMKANRSEIDKKIRDPVYVLGSDNSEKEEDKKDEEENDDKIDNESEEDSSEKEEDVEEDKIKEKEERKKTDS